jgi:hypothetical protein
MFVRDTCVCFLAGKPVARPKPEGWTGYSLEQLKFNLEMNELPLAGWCFAIELNWNDFMHFPWIFHGFFMYFSWICMAGQGSWVRPACDRRWPAAKSSSALRVFAAKAPRQRARSACVLLVCDTSWVCVCVCVCVCSRVRSFPCVVHLGVAASVRVASTTSRRFTPQMKMRVCHSHCSHCSHCHYCCHALSSVVSCHYCCHALSSVVSSCR